MKILLDYVSTVTDKEYFIVIIATVHHKGCFPQKACTLPNGFKSNNIYRFIALFSGRMDSGKKYGLGYLLAARTQA